MRSMKWLNDELNSRGLTRHGQTMARGPCSPHNPWYILPSMKRLTQTLHPFAAALAPMSHFRSHCDPSVKNFSCPRARANSYRKSNSESESLCWLSKSVVSLWEDNKRWQTGLTPQNHRLSLDWSKSCTGNGPVTARPEHKHTHMDCDW